MPSADQENPAARRWIVFLPLILLIIGMGIWAAVQRAKSNESARFDAPIAVDRKRPRLPRAPQTPRRVYGVVRDAKGQPVKSATVFLVLHSRKNIQVFQSVTEADGRYAITALPAGAAFEAILVAGAVDHSIAVQSCFVSQAENAAPDMVLSAANSSLTVQVMSEEGKSASNVVVEIIPEFARNIFRTTIPETPVSSSFIALQKLIRPQIPTNGQGEAHFKGLVPGRYYLSASRKKEGTSAYQPLWGDSEALWMVQDNTSDTVRAFGIPIAPHKASRFQVRLQQRNTLPSVTIVMPDATTHSLNNMEADALFPGFNGGRIGGAFLAYRGNNQAVAQMHTVPGGSRISFEIRPLSDLTVTDIATATEKQRALKHTNGLLITANSPYRGHRETIQWHSILPSSGTLRLQVLDADGKPTQAKVLLNSISGNHMTDAKGVIVFPDLPSGSTTVSATTTKGIYDQVTRDGNEEVDSFPSDAEIINCPVWRSKWIDILSGTQVNHVLRADPVGYIRVHIQGKYLRGRRFHLSSKDIDRFNVRVLYDHSKDEYVIGPLPPGLTTLRYTDGENVENRSIVIVEGKPSPIDPPREGGLNKTFTIVAGKVLHVNWGLDPALSSAPIRRSDLSRMGTAVQEENLNVRVLLPDGKTPAAGAYAFTYFPLSSNNRNGDLVTALRTGSGNFFADGSGHLRSGRFAETHAYTNFVPSGRDFYFSYAGEKEPIPLQQLRNPRLLVAFLPGSHGAAFLPLPVEKQSFAGNLILPASLSVTGHVVVGGKPLGPSVPGVVRVLARCTGNGGLNNILSVETVAQSDGSFTLAGLTPGKYIVQACLDDIWTSLPVSVTVVPGRIPQAMSLNIAFPGKPVTLSLGRKYAGAGAEWIDAPPTGPLDERYRPPFYPVDGAGEVHLEGLPAGKHRFRLADGKVINVNIAAL